MDEKLIQKYITNQRFATYSDLDEYKYNLKKSKHLYIPLSIVEVTLRNSINELYEKYYGRGWIINEASFLHQKELQKICDAKSKLNDRNEIINKDKLVAELTFGFWTGLFKTLYDKQMRVNTLKQIFPNLPSKTIQRVDRKVLSSKLNHIREFRNRVFHHENINKPEYEKIEDDIYEILGFFDGAIVDFVKELNKQS